MGNNVCRCQETIIFEKNNEFNDSSTNIENGFNVKNNYKISQNLVEKKSM